VKLLGIALALVVASAASAHAQAFPPDSAYVPLTCDLGPMTDLHADEPGALAERDLVGDARDAAGARATDADFLYLRLRLDDDPAPGGTLRPFAWGFAIDLDGRLSTYELLILADGIAGPGEVSVLRNTTTTTPNDPNDPADQPAVATFPATTHARSTVASGSSFGGTGDFHLELAIPWSELVPLGFDRDTRIHVWAASSSNATGLDGDFACHDGGSGPPNLDGIVSDPTVPDPLVDSDGDGFTDAQEIAAGSDPNDPNSVPASRLEGGGGCAVGGGELGLALGLLAIALGARRRRRA